jgi:Glycine rich protein
LGGRWVFGPAALAIALAVGAAPASAASKRFSYTGAEQTFVVPAEVRSLHVDAVGGAGGLGSPYAEGGLGASVATDIAVTPGETLYVEVGGAGSTGGPSVFGGGGAAGTDLLGGHPGGAGGGATDIRRLPRSAPGSDATRVVVAGGGGGGAGGLSGWRGGDANQDGYGCGGCGTSGVEGGAGTAGEGGLGGDPGSAAAGVGGDGGFGTGGAGGTRGGGGGGGGYYGGGGGGGGDTTVVGGGGGGGGGGASFVAGGAAATFSRTGVRPSVSFTYGEAVAGLTPAMVVFPARRIPTVGEQAVTVTNRGTIPLLVSGATITGAQASEFSAGPGCAAPVPPGAGCQIVVRFAPHATGRRIARLTVVSNGKPAAIGLWGVGLAVLKPTLTTLRISPSAFKAGRKPLVSYRADVAGTAKFRVLRVKAGKGRTKLVPIGASFTQTVRPGINRFRLGKTTQLSPGRYRLRGYGSGPSHAVSVGFRIARS